MIYLFVIICYEQCYNMSWLFPNIDNFEHNFCLNIKILANKTCYTLIRDEFEQMAMSCLWIYL